MVETIRQEGEHSPSQPVFEALLYPHRSLSPIHFFILMTIFGSFSLVLCIYFLLMGAWPVSGFLGLDILLLYWAFKSSFKTGEVQEIIRLEQDQLTVRRASLEEGTQIWVFNLFWVRVLRESRGLSDRLSLAAQGQKLEIGRFLTPLEKRELASVLRQELDCQKAARTA